VRNAAGGARVTAGCLTRLERGFEEHNPLLSAPGVGVWSGPLREEPR
jgi:hypothetical protein